MDALFWPRQNEPLRVPNEIIPKDKDDESIAIPPRLSARILTWGLIVIGNFIACLNGKYLILKYSEYIKIRIFRNMVFCF